MKALLSLPDSPCVIAAVGSGGKTTCLKAIACSSYAADQTVILTTTTHMRRENAVTTLSAPEEVTEFLQRHPVLFAGSPSGAEKISALPQSILSCLPELADLVLIEADGSKELPMKYPASFEPALPERVDHVLVLFGLSALGKPLAQVCHRWELAAKAFDWSGSDPVTAEMAAAVLKQGYLKPLKQQNTPFTVVLNQADLVSARDIDNLMTALSPARCAAVSFHQFPHDLT